MQQQQHRAFPLHCSIFIVIASSHVGAVVHLIPDTGAVERCHCQSPYQIKCRV